MTDEDTNSSSGNEEHDGHDGDHHEESGDEFPDYVAGDEKSSDEVASDEQDESEAGGSDASSDDDVDMSDLRPQEVGFDSDELDKFDEEGNYQSDSTAERRRAEYERRKAQEDDSSEEEEEEDEITEDELLIETDEGKEEERQREAERVTSQEFNWREEIETAWEKIQIWREEKLTEEAEDVRTAPKRAKEYFVRNQSARDYLIDIVLPLTLTVYGLLLLVATIIAGFQGGYLAEVMTEPHRVADLFILDTLLLVVASVLFVLARRVSRGDTSGDKIRRWLRLFVIGLHIVPTFVFVLVFAGTFQTNLLEEWSEGVFEWIAYFNATLPASITDIGTVIWDVTPIGVTVQQIAIVMFLAGIAASVPFAMGILKVFVVAVNTEADRDLSKMAALNLTGAGRAGAGSTTRRTVRGAIDVEQRGEEVEESSIAGFEHVSEMFEPSAEYEIEPYPGYKEHKRYWVNKPYAYVVILYNERNSDYRYFAVEPDMTSKEDVIYSELNDRLSRELLTQNVEERLKDTEKDEEVVRTRLLEDNALRIAQEYNIDIGDKSFQKIMYYLQRDYVQYGKIDPMINDPNTEDISCDGDNTNIFIFHAEYEDLLSNIKFGEEELRQFIIQLAQRSGEHISAADPMCDASLPDGSRAQLTLGDEVTAHGSTFTLRIFQDVPFTPIDLITTDTFNLDQISYLWLCIQHDMSLIFAGGTASGKTTTMNAISLFIPPKSKIVSLEDTRELTLPHSNWIPSVTRDSFGGDEVDEIDMYNLLEAALRQRPEYLLVGEVRGEEAVSLFQAMSTGHTTYSTMHADSVESAVFRLTNPPINVPEEMIQALDILCIQNQIHIQDEETGEVKRVRRNEKIGEIDRTEGSFRVNDAFTRDAEYDEFVADIDDSKVLEKIREQQGWNAVELNKQLKERRRVLKYMVDNGYDDVESVTRIVQAYIINAERVMERLEDGSLSPDDFDDLAEIETFEDAMPDTVLPHDLESELSGMHV